jgi:hypothetical protein
MGGDILAIDEALNFKRAYDPLMGRMYEVNINARPEQFLDWERPLSQMGQPVKKVLNEIWGTRGQEAMTGQDIYQTLRNLLVPEHKVGNLTIRNPDAAYTTHALAEAGIPGIKYLDQGSRLQPRINPNTQGGFDVSYPGNKWGPGQTGTQSFPTQQAAEDFVNKANTSNYVVFNPAIIDILKKYGLAGLTMGGVLQGQAESPPQ